MPSIPYYKTATEHIFDELCLLDSLLEIATSKIKSKISDNDDWQNQLNGLYISNEKIDSILQSGPKSKLSEKTFNSVNKILNLKRQEINSKIAESCKQNIYLPLDRLSKSFSLSELEKCTLIICVAPEIDSRYEKIYAFIQDDITKKKPTIDLILNILCNSFEEKISNRKFFSADSPLFKFKILNFEDEFLSNGVYNINKYYGLNSFSRVIKVDDYIINYIIDILQDPIDPKIKPFIDFVLKNDVKNIDEDNVLDTHYPNNYYINKNILQNNLKSSINITSNNSLCDDKDTYTVLKEKLKNIIEYCSQVTSTAKNDGYIFYLKGEKGIGRKTIIKSIVCNVIEKSLIIMNVSYFLMSLNYSSMNFEDLILFFIRQSILCDALIYMDNYDEFFYGYNSLIKEQYDDRNSDRLDDFKNQYLILLFIKKLKEFKTKILFLSGEKSWHISKSLFEIFGYEIIINFPKLNYDERKLIWKKYFAEYKIKEIDDLTLNSLANKFDFTPKQIKNAIVHAINEEISLQKEKISDSIDLPFLSKNFIKELHHGCHIQSNENLSSLANKLIVRHNIEEIVLPPEKKSQLFEILNYVKYKEQIFTNWGFDKKVSLGKGLNILFSGQSGTGKTMAAEIIANELDMEIYKIDLANIVSKYIGETEKKLDRLFKEAKTSNAILFFDEADALFGKRSEVKDAHDRYANIETNYLLQKLEEHREIVILASNLTNNMDNAFIRRINFRIDFPFPDEYNRLNIWKKMFPSFSPVGPDVDYIFLSKQFEITGGAIKNIALGSAFFAAAEKSDFINMKHIIIAVKREYEKMGRPIVKSEFGEYSNLL